MAFYTKLKWVLGILMVFILIITTNLIDKNNFVRVRDAVVTIYEDRLIANDLIFDMLKAVQKKEIAVIASDSAFFSHENLKTNADIKALIAQFEGTKLTKEEKHIFTSLKKNINLLTDTEPQFIDSNFADSEQIINHISNIKDNLSDLSKIQLKEGSVQMSISKRAVDTVELFTHIEIYILIILAIIIQIIVMYNPKKAS